MSMLLEIQQVCVRYRTNHAGVHSVKDLITTMTNPFASTEILHNISLSLERGQSLGILGRNGCGKSTLLRTVAGIIQPTSGTVRCHGTIAPILALGAGLEMELTGFENIHLLLALYGQSVTADELKSIADFSGLDQPTLQQAVKCYSSGMLARLAFSIAFSREADIYSIDEVMAVGDMGFQAKCMERIHTLQRKGKSFLFVSHSPDEVASICDQAILLDGGKLIKSGSSSDICREYKNLF